MSYSGYSLNGGVHPCLPFYERMLQCAKSEALPIKMCTAQTEDYLECHHRKKQYALNYAIKKELNNIRIVALPRYDEENDTFVPFSQATADHIFQ
ncbi:GRAM domain protein (macronuclear) [Tetrahymena thermophila SB210]|uniref:GRAM domain protein n=1 Tax=Tetrahymena thermophila (strain SB210) TaxID=312017 RepID=W7X4R4_TETTS|nr:GRAM domain protein [Tetrahymena thermophila SB210]7TGH_S5 Chain S5, GRAM domain protein [Tetrahymena thermophila]8B6F_B2 Chain B2, GRAM domain protein [Tetrahymena thermophila SB210]8BQS_B2 Chain B2, GRAM domain protein [Tetrahymena thermophila SB210]8GYM_S5 Chain S5, GRAM domain protein [Tetrahymena thermophila SB210]8GYM_s5 Chain s5, GRAM domain protein [Tetrahymena thermophila SB210]8GZU_S5 Chain S5, GRAM domain protein [Tetrahymena thermophila SB210]8GZU_s5 Chain s5, GRAM domain prot|eukprot:XP_012653126.1 GRAM domain protein [Tetrahymena thermophila SB210]